MTLALVGLPGSGKSTIGRLLARRLDVSFVDTDHEIERTLGCSIGTFFDREGEERFRDVEQQVLADLTGRKIGVLATGGGIVLRSSNREILRSCCRVVYLRSTPDEVFRRVRHDTGRPLLQVPDPLGRLRDLHAARDPFYQQTAHFSLDTGRPSVAMLVNTIAMQLELTGPAAGT